MTPEAVTTAETVTEAALESETAAETVAKTEPEAGHTMDVSDEPESEKPEAAEPEDGWSDESDLDWADAEEAENENNISGESVSEKSLTDEPEAQDDEPVELTQISETGFVDPNGEIFEFPAESVKPEPVTSSRTQNTVPDALSKIFGGALIAR
jgi:hypothetical protein